MGQKWKRNNNLLVKEAQGRKTETKKIFQEVKDKGQGPKLRELPCIWKKAKQSCDVPEAIVYTQACASGGGHCGGEIETVM